MKCAIPILLLLTAFISNAQIQLPANKQVKMTTATNTLIKNAPETFDLSNVSICVDRPVLNASLPPRNFSAVTPPPKINSDGSYQRVAFTRQPLAAETPKMWNPGETIKVYINPNHASDYMIFLVKKYAQEWEKIANVKFDFNQTFNNAQIRVRFGSDKRYWSWIGRDVLSNPLRDYTMNLGFADGSVDALRMSQIILHEFGHALGFIHEHQSPASGIAWDKEKVYQYFAEEPNKWSRIEVDLNVFNKYSSTTTNYSAYDPYSIMHYDIPPQLTLDGFTNGYNYTFSQTDRTYARQLYPFPLTPATATGTLRTGDDCDLVNFSVEYDVVPADQVEFVLELGRNQSNREITWWKQIVVPLTGNRESSLWVQNHSLIASENRKIISLQLPVAELDPNRGIGFWKAKMLGVHTPLNYKWQVIPALKGGCRVKLVWANDSCM
jgi:serralysin